MNIETNTPKTLRLRGLIIVGLILLSVGCKNDSEIPTENNTTSNNSIIGEWNWIKTIDAWTQQNTNPTTKGYNLTLNFKTNNTVESYKNDSLTDIYPYELKYRKNDPANPNSDSTMVLIINNGTETFFSIENDTLILDQSSFDGPKEFYEKIN